MEGVPVTVHDGWNEQGEIPRGEAYDKCQRAGAMIDVGGDLFLLPSKEEF